MTVQPRLGDLPAVLRAAGVPVKLERGWATRGHDGTFAPRYVVWHHDGTPAGPTPGGVSWVISGPWAHVWVGTDGVWHLCASGLTWHAGAGGPYADVPADVMNHHALGIETDHTTGEPWVQAQLDSLRRGTAAWMAHQGHPVDPFLLFHKTWAPGRKVDPDGLSLTMERLAVRRLMVQAPAPTPPAVPIPKPEEHPMDAIVYATATADAKGLPPSGYYLLTGGRLVNLNKDVLSGNAAIAGLPRITLTTPAAWADWAPLVVPTATYS